MSIFEKVGIGLMGLAGFGLIMLFGLWVHDGVNIKNKQYSQCAPLKTECYKITTAANSDSCVKYEKFCVERCK